jgi:hypothetical protein
MAVIAAVVLPVVVAWLEPLARSQEKPKTPSAAAFSSCREQEKIGDARACWAIWLQKFVSAGSEAEVAYAQEHAKGLQAPAPSSADPSQRPAPSPPPPPRPATPTAASPQTIPANTFVSLYSSPPSLVDLDGKRIGLTPIERVAFATRSTLGCLPALGGCGRRAPCQEVVLVGRGRDCLDRSAA